MDYVIFGIGLGATLVLVGWALRTFGPDLKHRAPSPDVVLSAAALVEKLSWTRFIMALGAVIATEGALMLVATIVTIAMTPTDRVGTLVVLSAFFIVLIGAVGWTWVYVGRYGTHGILPPRQSRVADEPERHETDVPLVAEAPDRVEEEANVERPAVEAEAPVEESVEEFLSGIDEERGVAAPVADAPAPEPLPPAESEPEEVAETAPSGMEVDVDAADPDEERVEAPVPADAASPAADDAAPRGDVDDAETAEREYVDILHRTSPDESGRAEALRRLRRRRASRMQTDGE